MRLMSWLATALAVAIVVAALSAQEKPNFSGEWILTAPTDGPAGFCGQQCTITQDATAVTVTRMTQAGQQKSTFKLDGSESTNAGQGSQARGGALGKAMWDGNKLRLSQWPSALRGDASFVFSMNAGQMEVETSATTGSGIDVLRVRHTYRKN